MPGFCTNCGTAIKAGVRFCRECGAQVKIPMAPPSLPFRETAQESVAKAPSAAPYVAVAPQSVPAPSSVPPVEPKKIADSPNTAASKSNKKILLIGGLSALVIIGIVGVVFYLHRNSTVDDTTIVSSIKAAFLKEAELSHSTIECTSEKGVVLSLIHISEPTRPY